MATHLPQRVLDRLSDHDRREYALHVGHPNAGLTSSDIERKRLGLAERQLQSEIRRFLAVKEIVFICPPMFRKSTLPVGWPDISFVHCGCPVLWECKSATGKLRASQERIVSQLVRNGWTFRLIRSLTEARDHLREIEKGPK